MALQVRLPLSSSVTNYGLSTVQASTSGTVAYASGIFGAECFNTGEGAVSFTAPDLTAMTISVWFRGTSPEAWTSLLSFGDSNSRIDISSDTTTLIFNCDSESILPNGTTLTSSLTAGYWHHLAIAADGTDVRIYLDGSKISTKTQANSVATALGTSKKFVLGGNTNETNLWDGYIQDFRLYDSALSTREIYEISKGLVLNYTFNHAGFGNSNLITGEDPELAITQTGETETATAREVGVTLNLEPGVYTYSATLASNDTGSGLVVSDFKLVLLVNGVQRNLTPKSTNVDWGWRYYSEFVISSASEVSLAVTYTLGVGQAGATINRFMVEDGAELTTWVPGINSAAYRALNLDTLEADGSGNELDGRKSTPAPLWTSDTPMYSGAYDFSNGSYVVSPVLDTQEIVSPVDPGSATHNNGIYISFWIKAESFTEGSIFFGFDTAPYFSFGISNGKFATFADNAVVYEYTDAAPYAGGWHFIVLMRSKMTGQYGLYIDGELIERNRGNTVGFGNGRLYINGNSANSVHRFNGKMSDFKVYSYTSGNANNDKRVADDYKVKLTIDNKGVVYASEFTNYESAITITEGSKVGFAQDVYTADGTVDTSTLTATGVTGYEQASLGRTVSTVTDLIEL
jgi:hypothetical protein